MSLNRWICNSIICKVIQFLYVILRNYINLIKFSVTLAKMWGEIGGKMSQHEQYYPMISNNPYFAANIVLYFFSFKWLICWKKRWWGVEVRINSFVASLKWVVSWNVNIFQTYSYKTYNSFLHTVYNRLYDFFGAPPKKLL